MKRFERDWRIRWTVMAGVAGVALSLGMTAWGVVSAAMGW